MAAHSICKVNQNALLAPFSAFTGVSCSRISLTSNICWPLSESVGSGESPFCPVLVNCSVCVALNIV